MAAPSIPGYDLVRRLGVGSFASVWVADDLRLDREVAVKVLAEQWCGNPDVRRSFMNEARVLVTAESPRLARGFAVDETADGRPYLVMALADRGTLADRMATRARAEHRLSPHAALAIAGELALAIADVHALGHLHRDVKPSNVLVMTIPPGVTAPAVAGLALDERVVLSDFGLVHRPGGDRTAVVGGSPGYVSPEQARGDDADERSDLYSLGVIAMELLCGRAADTPQSLAQASGPTVRRSDVRSRLAAGGTVLASPAVDLLDELLSHDVRDRPNSAGEVARRITEITASLPDSDAAHDATTPKVPGHEPDRPSAPRRRRVRMGLWGQDLHLAGDDRSEAARSDDSDRSGQPRKSVRVEMPPGAADETVVRTRANPPSRSSALPGAAAEPNAQSAPVPNEARSALVLDVVVLVLALALVGAAFVVWLR